MSRIQSVFRRKRGSGSSAARGSATAGKFRPLDLPKPWLARAEPQGAARALDQGSDGLDAGRPRLRCSSGSERVRQAQPLLAVVVAVGEEVLGDQHAHLRPERGRQNEHREQQERAEHQHGLEHAPPRAAELPQQEPRPRQDQQVNAGEQQRRRTRDHAARDRQVERPVGAPAQGHEDERNGQRLREAAGEPQVEVQGAEQQGVRIQRDVEGEQAGEAEDQRTDVPAGR